MRYHINPKTGEAGVCRAQHTCPFGGDDAHYSSKAEAQQAYEASQQTTPPTMRKVNGHLVCTNPTYSSDGEVNRIAHLIREALLDQQWVEENDILKGEYKDGALPFSGHCYAASQALYFAMGAKAAGWKPVHLEHEGSSHWWLQSPSGEVIDLTSEQFATPVPYQNGRGMGFQNKDPREPDRRARAILEKINVAVKRVA